MLVPNRHGSSNSYRYGFNGMEKDDEIKGEGLQYDYGFRIYDPRIGKFLSTDPLFKSFPWYTPYQFAGNKPIMAIDLDGLEEATVTIKEFLENGQCLVNITTSSGVLSDSNEGNLILKLNSAHGLNLTPSDIQLGVAGGISYNPNPLVSGPTYDYSLNVTFSAIKENNAEIYNADTSEFITVKRFMKDGTVVSRPQNKFGIQNGVEFSDSFSTFSFDTKTTINVVTSGLGQGYGGLKTTDELLNGKGEVQGILPVLDEFEKNLTDKGLDNSDVTHVRAGLDSESSIEEREKLKNSLSERYPNADIEVDDLGPGVHLESVINIQDYVKKISKKNEKE